MWMVLPKIHLSKATTGKREGTRKSMNGEAKKKERERREEGNDAYNLCLGMRST